MLAASVLKAVLRYGKKQYTVDETRRDTYKNPVASGNEPPVLATFEDNVKQLLAVRNSFFHFHFLFLPARLCKPERKLDKCLKNYDSLKI